MSLLPDQEANIRRLMEAAINDAFQEQVAHIYKIYLSNVTHPDKQKNAKAGIVNAIEAYRLAIAVIDAWEAEQDK